jgi:hypothetical protein
MPLEACGFGFSKILLVKSNASLLISLGNFLLALLNQGLSFLALIIVRL